MTEDNKRESKPMVLVALSTPSINLLLLQDFSYTKGLILSVPTWDRSDEASFKI